MSGKKTFRYVTQSYIRCAPLLPEPNCSSFHVVLRNTNTFLCLASKWHNIFSPDNGLPVIGNSSFMCNETWMDQEYIFVAQECLIVFTILIHIFFLFLRLDGLCTNGSPDNGNFCLYKFSHSPSPTFLLILSF